MKPVRDYASFSNLRKAALLAVPMTLLAAPRILLCGLPSAFVVAAYCGLFLTGGMATAWSGYAGMKGLFPPFREVSRGFIAVFAILVAVVPVQVFFLNPMLYRVISEAGDQTALDVLFPGTIPTALAFVFWSMSFETIFFRAAAMSFFARLTKRFVPAVLLAVGLGVFVGYLKFDELGIVSNAWPILGMAGLMSAVSCCIFARYGLLPAMVLSGGLVVTRFTP